MREFKESYPLSQTFKRIFIESLNYHRDYGIEISVIIHSKEYTLCINNLEKNFKN